jgi:hypothetical protein
MSKKYNNEIVSAESWDFIKGYKEAIHINTKPISDTEPAEIIVNGKLPFVVLVPELFTDIKKNKSVMTFLVDIIDVIGEVSFQKHIVKENQTPLQIAIEDINGEFSFSTFNMRIISGNPKEKPLKNRILNNGEYSLDNIFDLAVEVLKQFILSYRGACELEGLKYDITVRHLFKKDWIPEIERNRLSPWVDTQVFDKNGNSLFQKPHYDYRGTGVALGTDLKDDTLTMLQTYCKSIITLDNRHYLQIANRHYIRHEYEAFCIILVSVMEKEIFKLFREKLLNKGLNSSEIEAKMFNGDKKRKDGVSREFVAVKKALNIICDGKKLDEIPEFKLVHSAIYTIRDEIIHGDIIRVSKLEADLMFKAYRGYIQYLENSVKKKEGMKPK